MAQKKATPKKTKKAVKSATKTVTKKVSVKKPKAQARTKVKTTQAPGFSVWQLSLLAVISLVASYIFASLALDSGSYWHYIMFFATVYLGVKFLGIAVKSFTKKGTTKRS